MAGGRFFDSSGASPTLSPDAGPVAGAAGSAGSAVLWPGLGLTAAPWVWVLLVAWAVVLVVVLVVVALVVA